MKQATISNDTFESRKKKYNSVFGQVSKMLANGAAAWNTSRRTMILIWLIPFIVFLAAVAFALMGKEMYKLYTGEDLIAESLQVLFYAVALILGIVITRRIWAQGLTGIGILYLIVCAGLCFLIGEELNWGQRIFGWETPEAFKAINKQKETNLHNIYGVGFTFKWLQMVVGAYGSLLPLLVWGLNGLRPYRQTLSYTVPHVTLIPFFLPLFLWRIYRNFFEAPKAYYFAIAEFNEVMELNLAIGFALFMFFQYRRLKMPVTTR
jgi:hypothetical protein